MKKKTTTTTTNLFKISKTIKIHSTISKLKKIRLKIALKELVVRFKSIRKREIVMNIMQKKVPIRRFGTYKHSPKSLFSLCSLAIAFWKNW